MSKSGIHIKPSHVGRLHQHLGLAEGEHISRAVLHKAKESTNPAIRKEATFALNARGWHHGK